MNKHTIKQQGFVSIIVAAVLMILISLVTIGFTKLMQREQRQALDRQLSTQAFYAAETGINDVRNRIQNNDPIPEEKTGCDLSAWNNGVVDPATPTVTYTCLEYDKTPLDLVFTGTINRSSSKVFPIDTKSTIGSITFEWDGSPGNSTEIDDAADSCVSPAVLPAIFNKSNAIPVLRIDLIKTPKVGDGNITRNYLMDNTASMYLYPKSCAGTKTVDFKDYIGDDQSGRVIDVDCTGNVNNKCMMTINMPQAPEDTNRYYARVKSIYNDVGTLVVTAKDQSLAGALELKNAQVLVDSTGRANDVLRRIEVRLSSTPNYEWPEAVIETSEGLCKLLQVAPPSTVRNSNCYN